MGIKWLLISNAVLLGIFIVIPICRNLALYIFEKLSDTRKSKMISIMIFFGFLLIALALIFAISENDDDKSTRQIYSTNNQKNTFVLPDNANKISANYFSDRDNLKSIYFYGDDTEIDTATFAGCEKLKQVNLPSNLSEIKPLTFAYCKSLTTIDIPDSVTHIGNGAFLNCESLTEIEIHGHIGRDSFAGCSSLKKIKFDNYVMKEIPEGAFRQCKRLENLYIPFPVECIESNSFSDCEALKKIYLPISIEFIGNSAFKNCTSLTDITLASSTTHIDRSAFDNCKELSCIIIPNSYTHIDVSNDSFTGIENKVEIKYFTGERPSKKELQEILKRKDLTTLNWLKTSEGE